MECDNVLNVKFLKQAYHHPHAAGHRFELSPTICPQCQTELAFVKKEENGRRELICQNCGHLYQERSIHVA